MDPHFRQALRLALDDLGMRFGHDILVLNRYHRDINSHHAAGLPREIASRRNDMLAVMSPLSVETLHSPFASRSIAVTVVWRLISAPRSRAPRASDCVKSAG